MGGGSQIGNRRSGLVVDIANGSYSDHAIIQQFAPHTGTNQQWRVILMAGGYVRIESVHTGKCLEACNPWSGAFVAQHAFNGHISQYWRLVLVKSVVDLKLVNAASGKAMEVPGFSLADQTVVRQATWARRANQVWFFETLGGQRNKIVARCSGKAMDIPGGNPADQVPIQQFRDHGGINQQFDVLHMGGGLFKIRSPLTWKVFDVPFGAPVDGLPLQQFTDNGGLNQRFRIEFAN
jgi:hypothetical protein